jgi:hypothetical protein
LTFITASIATYVSGDLSNIIATRSPDDSACAQMTRELIGTAIKIAIAQNDAAADDGIIRREADAGFLEKMIEPLARSPAECIARMLAYDSLRAAEVADSVQIRLPLGERA